MWEIIHRNSLFTDFIELTERSTPEDGVYEERHHLLGGGMERP